MAEKFNFSVRFVSNQSIIGIVMYYLTRQELLQKLDIDDDQLEDLEESKIIKPFTDTNGELIYAESWVEGINDLQAVQNDRLYEYEGFYRGWSPDEARQRLMSLIEKFNIDINNPDANTVWKAYKFFLNEPIIDDLGSRGNDFIETAHRDNQAALHLIRQFSYYDMSQPEGCEYDHMDQLTIMLKFDPSEELNQTSLQEWITSDVDQCVAEIESMEDFKTIMRHKPKICLIDQITQ